MNSSEEENNPSTLKNRKSVLEESTTDRVENVDEVSKKHYVGN